MGALLSLSWPREVLARYAQFAGRARRHEYWRFILHYLLAYVLLLVIDVITGTFSFETQMGLTSGLFVLFMFVPGLAVAVRRLHDTGRSGAWLLLMLLPFFGTLVLLFFFIQEGDEGDNRYGADPKVKPL